jgi:hypothetical protein
MRIFLHHVTPLEARPWDLSKDPTMSIFNGTQHGAVIKILKITSPKKKGKKVGYCKGKAHQDN